MSQCVTDHTSEQIFHKRSSIEYLDSQFEAAPCATGFDRFSSIFNQRKRKDSVVSWNSLHEDSENALDLNMAPDLLKNDCPVGSPKSISFLSSTNSLGNISVLEKQRLTQNKEDEQSNLDEIAHYSNILNTMMQMQVKDALNCNSSSDEVNACSLHKNVSEKSLKASDSSNNLSNSANDSKSRVKLFRKSFRGLKKSLSADATPPDSNSKQLKKSDSRKDDKRCDSSMLEGRLKRSLSNSLDRLKYQRLGEYRESARIRYWEIMKNIDRHSKNDFKRLWAFYSALEALVESLSYELVAESSSSSIKPKNAANVRKIRDLLENESEKMKILYSGNFKKDKMELLRLQADLAPVLFLNPVKSLEMIKSLTKNEKGFDSQIVLTDLQETILQLSRKSSSKLAKVAVLLETYTPLIIIKKELSVNSDFEGMNSKLLRICSDSQG